MSSSTSSSDPACSDAVRSDPDWRGFFWLAAGTAAVVIGVIFLFVVTVDPWDELPLSPPLDRVPVTSNQRFAYPALARSPAFDSAVFGTSSNRLLKPATLNRLLGGRFVNLAMNAATPYEQLRLMTVFTRNHPAAKRIILGIDLVWCETGDAAPKLTPRPFPEWMYRRDRWPGYREMLNLFAIQEAGKEFGVLTGLKREDQGRDGYTVFVPPDDQYDPARAAVHLREDGIAVPHGERDGPPESWRFSAFEGLRPLLAGLAPETETILFLVPYNRIRLPPPGHPGALAWAECKRRLTALARLVSNGAARPPGGVLVIDFLKHSPITDDDNNYWSSMHYRVGVADRVVMDLAGASRGEVSPDYDVLSAQP